MNLPLSGWCTRGAHHRCIGSYDALCLCGCHSRQVPEMWDEQNGPPEHAIGCGCGHCPAEPN